MTTVPKKAKLKSGDQSGVVRKRKIMKEEEETAFSGDSEEESDVEMEANFALLSKNRTAGGEEEEGDEGSDEEDGEGIDDEEEGEGSDDEEEGEGSDEEEGEGSDEEEQGEGSDEDDEGESSDEDDESGETKEVDTGGNAHTEKDVKKGELRSCSSLHLACG